MSDDFVDSNVLIYQLDETNPLKMERADDVIFRGMREGSLIISFQVVQETLNVLTGKLRTVVSESDRDRFFTGVLLPLWKVMPSAALYHRALDVQARYRYSFYDSLIIAAALSAGCTRIYSEDLQHGQKIDGLTIVNPFED